MSALDPRVRDLAKCEDMRIHAGRAYEYRGTCSVAEFLSNELVQDAVIRCVEVIGEAARQVSEPTRLKAPSVPWSLIIGMRNILAHDYGQVDLDQVYRVVRVHLPELLQQLDPLIAELERETGWQDGKGE